MRELACDFWLIVSDASAIGFEHFDETRSAPGSWVGVLGQKWGVLWKEETEEDIKEYRRGPERSERFLLYNTVGEGSLRSFGIFGQTCQC